MAPFAVGIDLGTTNCALAWIDLSSSPPFQAKVLPIPQLVEAGEVEDRVLLPSFCYRPSEHEMNAAALVLPWGPSPAWVVGEAARRWGAKVPGRLVASAKSWLCHAGVDRKAKILPWQTDADIEPISPVEASTFYLSHLRDAWNAGPGRTDAKARLEEQDVVITIPASFDEVARELTVQAAAQAGLARVTLLEEPQAAFYQWLEASQERQPLEIGTVCLVIDCGGGTSDFSLLSVGEHEGRRAYQRLAVGNHLLLGGDNIDIAIARHLEAELSPARRLDLTAWWNLVLNARRIKEAMLSDNPPETIPVAVLGRGRRVVGDVLKGEIARQTVHEIALEGFFPRVERDAVPETSGRMGLQEFGLPFVADPAITRHLAHFLAQHQEQIRAISGNDFPTAVLFNGGVFNAAGCRRRVLEVLTSWYGADWKPRVLEASSLDLAVAQGAADYAAIRVRGGDKIRSATARSYYIGIEASNPDSHKQTVVCVVPQGLEEENLLVIEEPALELQLGEPVAFPLYSSTVRSTDRAGAVLEVTPGQLETLPALTTILRGGKRTGRKRIGVRLESRLTPIGTVEIHCRAREGDNRWKLEFSTRGLRSAIQVADAAPRDTSSVAETWSEEQLEGARAAIDKVYKNERVAADPMQAVHLVKSIEAALGMSRSEWPTSLLRGLWNSLADVINQRGKTPEHEARWFNLAGYFLRPGWGDLVDPFRVEQLWKGVHAGVFSTKADRPWIEYWIMLRRVAGGLDPSRQLELGRRLLSQLGVIGSKKQGKRFGGHELAEMWRAAASLEHLPPHQKQLMVAALFNQLAQPPIPPHLFWSLARLGTRVPLYGPANLVIPVSEIENALERLLDWKAPDSAQERERDFVLSQWARMSGDRARDIDHDLRERVLSRLKKAEAPPSWIRVVEEQGVLEQEEETRLVGDSLPRGLKIL